MAFDAPAAAAELLHLYGELRCSDQAAIDQCTEKLTALLCDHEAIGLLNLAYITSSDAYYKQCVLFSFRHLLSTLTARSHVRVAQESLLTLLRTETERAFQAALMAILLDILSYTDLIPLDSFFETETAYTEVLLMLLGHCLSAGVGIGDELCHRMLSQWDWGFLPVVYLDNHLQQT
jgi:hypothetical protein